METMTAYQQITPTRDLTPQLFSDFVAWIDRGEKTTKTYIKNLRQFAAWLAYKAITRPIRQDIISYREWLTAEHDAISLDPDSVTGWKYRTDGAGAPLKVNCKPNTITQYLRSVCQFFRWTAANNLYPDIAAGAGADSGGGDQRYSRTHTAQHGAGQAAISYLSFSGQCRA